VTSIRQRIAAAAYAADREIDKFLPGYRYIQEAEAHQREIERIHAEAASRGPKADAGDEFADWDAIAEVAPRLRAEAASREPAASAVDEVADRDVASEPEWDNEDSAAWDAAHPEEPGGQPPYPEAGS